MPTLELTLQRKDRQRLSRHRRPDPPGRIPAPAPRRDAHA